MIAGYHVLPMEWNRIPMRLSNFLRKLRFPGSSKYWESRYQSGGDSGVGSYEKFAEFKSRVLNEFVARQDIGSIIEFGCGDGNQLTYANYPNYLGVDISATAIDSCRKRFSDDPTKRFTTLDEYDGQTADLSLSLDVIYHLIEDEVYASHLRALFDAAERFVAIYSSNRSDASLNEAPHIRHRRFTDWIDENRPEWELIQRVPNQFPYAGDYRSGSWSDFYFFAKPD